MDETARRLPETARMRTAAGVKSNIRTLSDPAEFAYAPMVGVAIANFDDNQHARNENLRLGNLWDGIEVYAGLLADLNW